MEDLIWKRQRKNRFGIERVPVKVIGETPAGNAIVSYLRSNLSECRCIVKPSSLEPPE